MKSVHTNDQGKYAVGLFEVSVQANLSEEWVTSLFATYAKTSTPLYYTYNGVETRWLQLIANSVQVVRSDIIRKIAHKMNWNHTDARINVQTAAGLPGYARGSTRTSTPRAGTKRVLANKPYARGLTAR